MPNPHHTTPEEPGDAVKADTQAIKPPDAAGGLTEELKAKIIAADIANIIKKVKAGKPLSDSERAIIANYNTKPQDQPPNPGTTSPTSSIGRIKKGYGSRSTDQVVEDRIAEACAVLAQKPSIHRSELHQLFQKRWISKDGHPADWRTIDRLVSRARGRLSERTKRPKDEWIDDILNGYDMDIASEDPRVRMAARLGIRDMLGLDAARKVVVGGPSEAGGEALGPLVIRVTGEEMPKPKAIAGQVIDIKTVDDNP